MGRTRGTRGIVAALSIALSLSGALGASLYASAANTRTAAVTSGLPLYEFTRTGTANLPWVATSLSKLTGGATMSAGPRTVDRSGLRI